MTDKPVILMTAPTHFEVSYTINPWMKPGSWASDPAGNRARATAASDALRAALTRAGARVETVPGAAGLPDMVFPANAAIVLDRKALVARFRFPERQGEETHFLHAFERLAAAGLLDAVAQFPEGCFQEGAGDCIWDATRGMFWAGFGPRSSEASLAVTRRFFGQEVTPLELVSDRFYHLDTCFCPLSGGEILFFPPAFSDEALATLRAIVPADMLIEASEEDAARFCVNAVNLDRTIVMAEPAPRLVAVLNERGYRVEGVDLSPFIMSGGGAYCMTLRLDRTSAPSVALKRAG